MRKACLVLSLQLSSISTFTPSIIVLMKHCLKYILRSVYEYNFISQDSAPAIYLASRKTGF